MVTINVNGVRRELQAPSDTPLVYVLRNDMEISGISPVSAAAGKKIARRLPLKPGYVQTLLKA
jgi:hypothetical protein